MHGRITPAFARAAATIHPLLLLVVLACCGGADPRKDPQPASPDEYVVQGWERLAWNQSAPSASDVARYDYAVYVDGQRRTLERVVCTPDRPSGGSVCTAPLPVLLPGRHLVEVVAVANVGGQLLESARSAPIVVTTSSGTVSGTSRDGDREVRYGAPFVVEVVTHGLTRPAAFAFPPDGRLLVAERDGTVKIVERGRTPQVALAAEDLLESGEVIVHDLILHPEFALNRYALLLYTAIDSSGAFTRIMRFRERGGTLTEPMLILAGVASTPYEPTAAAMFGASGELYVATATGDAAVRSGSIAEPGNLLLLSDEGALNHSRGGGGPAWEFRRPVAMGFNPLTGRAWLVARDDGSGEPEMLDDLAVEFVRRKHAVAARMYTGLELRMLRGSILVASAEDQHVEWLRFETATQRWVRQGTILTRRLGRIGPVGQGADELVYVGTDNSVPGVPFRDVVVRLAPDPRMKSRVE